MKAVILMFSLVSWAAVAAPVVCRTQGLEFRIEMKNSDILITHNREVVYADGVLTESEVDLVANFPSYGEMTLFAKIGKNTPESYLYFQGQRIPVQCR